MTRGAPDLNDITASILSERLQRILDLHFDPIDGAPYWLERARTLGLDPRREIRDFRDLEKLGLLDQQALASRPVEDFLPAPIRAHPEELVVAETGGTTGEGKYAVFHDDEFQEAFVDPFTAAATRCGFPRGSSWLFVGPSGPHIIGKAARACARALGAPDPFMVDFDPRWARRLVEGSLARARYLRHLEDQALRITETQSVGVLFATPAVLEGLAERMSDSSRSRVQGIHFGGLPVESRLRERLEVLFPAAVLLSGYGNSLLGMMPELEWSPEEGIAYYPHGNRLVVTVVEDPPEDGGPAGEPWFPAPVSPGTRGRVLAHRLDGTQFLPNILERDTAVALPAPEGLEEEGFLLPGIREPRPVAPRKTRTGTGFY